MEISLFTLAFQYMTTKTIHICTMKLRKECNLLELSVG